jgi:hypothetical protein
MRASLLEECYEVLEAIDAGEPRRLATELGDLLMQIVFQAQLAAEAGDFTLSDVIRGINEKLVRRHPHVFGDVKVGGTAEVLQNWEAIKKEERLAEPGMLSGVPRALPALAAAQSIQERAARVGFDWPDAEGPRAKVSEELAELDRARAARLPLRPDPKKNGLLAIILGLLGGVGLALLAEFLAERVQAALGDSAAQPLRILDPACGDGRLLDTGQRTPLSVNLDYLDSHALGDSLVMNGFLGDIKIGRAHV